MTDDQRELFEQIAEGRSGVTDGHIGGPFDAWCLNPAIGKALNRLGGAIRFKPTIDRRYMELAILVTGQLWQAQFEWFAHEPMARDAGLPENVISSIKLGEEPTFDDDGDEAAWRFCTTLHREKKVDDATYLATVARFGEAGVADLIAACGMYTLVSMTLNVFDVELPAGATYPFPT
ncbi:MAG: 4-carboxymuconolactone decarboxylase [Candidatus Poriferisodalaceae bacterium]|jgi:4-carboxymuconolactone decarboxylase